MQLTPQDISKLQVLFKQQCGIEITPEEALVQGLHLVSMLQFVYKPMTQEQTDEITKRKVA